MKKNPIFYMGKLFPIHALEVLKKITHRKYSYLMVTILVILALVGSSFQVNATGVTVPSQQAGLPTWPTNPNWQSYVPGPSSDDVKPVAITRAHWQVTNPEGLLGQNSNPVTLTKVAGGPDAVIVLDYGQEVGGTPYIQVATNTASGTSNTVTINTSEALPFLNNGANTTLSRATTAGATNVKVASVSPFAVGTSITVDSGTATETRNVASVGTAAATGALKSC